MQRKWHIEQENKYKKTHRKKRTNSDGKPKGGKNQLVTAISLCYPWNVTHTLKQAQDYFCFS